MKKVLLAMMMILPLMVSAQVLNNWNPDEPSGSGVDMTLTQESATVNEGTYALKVDLLTDQTPYLYSEVFSVTENDAYTFSIDVLDNTSMASLKIYFEFYDNTGGDIFGEDPQWTVDNADWQTISWSGTVPAGAVEGYVWIKVYSDEGFTAPATLYLDNASYTVGGGANQVPNGGFEEWSDFVTEFFVDFNDGTIPVEWLVINANEGENDNGGEGQNTWIIGEFGLDGTQCIFNDTYDEVNENPADDWFVSPLVMLTDGHEFSFWADASADFPDSLNLWASKTGRAVEDFTIAIARNEVAGAFSKFTFIPTEHPDLAEGDMVYFGLHNNTLGSFIDVDNVRYGEPQEPQITYAYAVSATAVNVVFDIPLSEGDVSTADFTLQGTASITFSDGAIDPDDSKVFNLTGASASMSGDLTVDSIRNDVLGSVFEFYAGILGIENTSLTGGSLVETGDYPATYQGVVTAKDVDGDRVWLQDGTGQHSGVNTYAGDVYDMVEVGDEILLSSVLDPFDGQSELYLPRFISTVSTGNTVAASGVDGSAINRDIEVDADPAEAWESVLVTLDNVKVIGYEEGDPELESDNYYIATDDAYATQFRIGNRFGVYPEEFNDQLFVIGDIYNITGIVVGRGGVWSVMPRSSSDLEFVSSGVGLEDEFSLKVNFYPNPVGDRLMVQGKEMLRSVSIYDLGGRRLLSVEVTSLRANVDVSSLKAGSYLVKAEMMNGEQVETGIVKK